MNADHMGPWEGDEEMDLTPGPIVPAKPEAAPTEEAWIWWQAYRDAHRRRGPFPTGLATLIDPAGEAAEALHAFVEARSAAGRGE